MGHFTVSVADETFTLACKDGEEERLSDLASRVDTKAKLLRDRLGGIDERRLLLMAAMLLTDELDEMRDERDHARSEIKQARRQGASGPPSEPAAAAGVPESEVSRFVEAVCDELEQLAQKLETA